MVDHSRISRPIGVCDVPLWICHQTLDTGSATFLCYRRGSLDGAVGSCFPQDSVAHPIVDPGVNRIA
jgi:hypothetical protein